MNVLLHVNYNWFCMTSSEASITGQEYFIIIFHLRAIWNTFEGRPRGDDKECDPQWKVSLWVRTEFKFMYTSMFFSVVPTFDPRV